MWPKRKHTALKMSQRKRLNLSFASVVSELQSRKIQPFELLSMEASGFLHQLVRAPTPAPSLNDYSTTCLLQGLQANLSYPEIALCPSKMNVYIL